MTAAMKGRQVKLVLGGESRVELLPPEVAARASNRATRRSLVGVVMLAVLVSAGGFAAASTYEAASRDLLEADQEVTSELLAEQSQFSDVNRIEADLQTVTAARQLGVSTEIDWRSYLEALGATLPAGVTITSVAAESSTPMQPIAQADAPLQTARAGTVVFTAESPDLPEVAQWLTSLESMAGFGDASPDSIVTMEEGGYSVSITLHVGAGALANRFIETPTEDEE